LGVSFRLKSPANRIEDIVGFIDAGDEVLDGLIYINLLAADGHRRDWLAEVHKTLDISLKVFQDAKDFFQVFDGCNIWNPIVNLVRIAIITHIITHLLSFWLLVSFPG